MEIYKNVYGSNYGVWIIIILAKRQDAPQKMCLMKTNPNQKKINITTGFMSPLTMSMSFADILAMTPRSKGVGVRGRGYGTGSACMIFAAH